jgi:DNA polymerase-3 subunit epsilon/ATP-dependent DNA helicase DinG
MPSIVALDIETTGLDPYRDEIIEIGAVRFNGKRIEDEWSTLIKPRQAIPPFITQLTGISNEMVFNAPEVQDVIQEFADFVGNAPILGQNLQFDLSFLQRQRVLQYNQVIDTYELASVLMPTAGRYNLSALGQALGIILPGDAHRALYDAQLTTAVYQALLQKAMEMPLERIAEFVRLSEPFDWGASYVFQIILKSRAYEPVKTSSRGQQISLQVLKEFDAGIPLEPTGQTLPLDAEEVSALLEYGGPFSAYFPNYEQRQQQVEMLRAVTQAISEGRHLMVEAGTGTGKSFAYLIPAALWSIQNGMRVVISTNTINLQDQLINKDVPDLAAALNINLRATVLKGRSNYLCPHRLQAMRQRGPDTVEEMRVLAKILVWLYEGGSGDRNQINLNGPVEREIWMRLSAENEGCKQEVCINKMGGVCPFYQSRRAADSSHILIVNHALLLADVATGNRVLPDYEYLIIDEGHHLESAVTSSLSFDVNQSDLTRMLKELGGTNSGILGHIERLLLGKINPSESASLNQAVIRQTDLNFRLDHDLTNFFKVLDHFLLEQREGRPVGAYGQQERITSATRTLPAWTEVEIAWDIAGETFELLLNLLTQIIKSLGMMSDSNDDDLEDSLSSLSNVFRRLSETRQQMASMVADPNSDSIYWVEIKPNRNQLSLNVAPLHIGPLMEKYLWLEKTSVIVTSATLTANGEFDYLRNRLFAVDADELSLGSPFDFETAAMLYITDDIPEPANAGAYQRSLDHVIRNLAVATSGRMLVLFTSYSQLKKTSAAIGPYLGEHGIQVYEQGEGASASTLLDNFKTSEKAVLLGTRSFWEGVDIPGDALSVLVITRLPFDVPSDPIIAARSETFEDAFNEYNLPEAILRFRQGFGRLIRTESDRGIAVVLDKRILTKRYGRMFIESLPECTRKVGKMSDLPALAQRWLNI